MEMFSIYEFIYGSVKDQLYAYCDFLDEDHLGLAFDMLDSFSLGWIRRYVKENRLDPYNEYWYHRKIIVIQSVLIVMAQRLLHENKYHLIQFLLDCWTE